MGVDGLEAVNQIITYTHDKAAGAHPNTNRGEKIIIHLTTYPTKGLFLFFFSSVCPFVHTSHLPSDRAHSSMLQIEMIIINNRRQNLPESVFDAPTPVPPANRY